MHRRRPFLAPLAAALCVAISSGPTASGDTPPAPRLVWHDVDHDERWSVALDPGPLAPGRTLRAPDWYPPLPDLEIRLLDGGSFPLARARGSVLVLDFWASWCEPCRRELPLLQALYDARREAGGLEALAINVDEPAQVAAEFAEALGLTLPVGLHETSDSPRLSGQVLPTILVADRSGRIRGRWDGYQTGDERAVAALVDRLLAEGEPAERALAEVREDRLGLDLRWLRRIHAPIDGVAFVPSPIDGTASILAAAGRTLTLYEADGRTAEHWPDADSMTELRIAPGDGIRVAGFRPGSRRVTLVASPDAEAETVEAPQPVFDVAWLPTPGGEARLLVAGAGGLHERQADGTLAQASDLGSLSSLVVTGNGPRIGALGFDGRLAWLDAALLVERTLGAPEHAWRLVPDGDAGTGFATPGIATAVTASLTGDDARQVALVVGHELRVIALDDGAPLFRADWPGLTALAAGDLDGDGRDELVVGAGSDLGVIAVATN